jgi:ferritin-like metal-binding protein YciE
LAVAELQSLLRSEPRLTKAWSKLARRAQAKPLKTLCREGVTYTRRRVERIRKALDALDAPKVGRPSQGMDGLIADALKASAIIAPAERDASLLAAIERISHYGEAIYRSIDRYLQRSRDAQARRILAPSLKEKREAIAEEGEMARKKLIPALGAAPR